MRLPSFIARLLTFLRGPRGWMAALPFALIVESILFPYEVGLHNHSIQLPYVYWLNDRTLYPNDRFMESMRDYFSYFWFGVAWLIRVFPQDAVLFSIHALTLLARYGALWAIARRAFPRWPGAAWAAVWFNLFAETPLGMESLHWFYTAHTPAATALGFWAVWAACGGRWLLGFALAGLVFNLHAMQSAYLLLMLGLAAVLVPRDEDADAPEPPLADRLRTWARVLLPAGVLYLLCAAPGLFWMLRSEAVAAPEDFGDLIRAFFPRHFFPHSFKLPELVLLLIYLAMLTVAVLRLSRRHRTLPPENPRRTPRAPMLRLAAMAAALLLLGTVGGVLIEKYDSPILIKLHIYRASSIFCPIVLVLFAGWLVSAVPRTRWGWAALLLAAEVVAFQLPYWHTPPDWKPFGWMALAAGCAALWVARPRRHARVQGEARQLALVIVAAVLGLFAWALVRVHGWRIYWDDRFNSHIRNYHRVARWAGENTPKDAKFLTPPDVTGFRAFAKRSAVFEWIDGAALLWDASYADYWRSRYLQAGGELPVPKAPHDFIAFRVAYFWHLKPQEELNAIARREGADYILYYRHTQPGAGDPPPPVHWSGGTVIFDDGRDFIIVRLEEETAEERQ